MNETGIMVLCKVCEKYTKLLVAKEKEDPVILDERIKERTNCKDNDNITTAKGMEITGKSEAQVRRYLKVLCELGFIKSTRTTKGNFYIKG